MSDTYLRWVFLAAGIALYFLVRRRVVGRWLWWCVAAFAIVMTAGHAVALPPAGRAESYRVVWSGGSAGNGAWVVTWNGSNWSATDSRGVVTISAWSSGGVSGLNVDLWEDVSTGYPKAAGLRWSDYPTGGDDPLTLRTWGGGGYVWTSAGAYHDATSGEAGNVQVLPVGEPTGESYAGEAIQFQVIWAIGDTLWRGQTGQRVAPLQMLTHAQFWPRMILGVENPVTSQWDVSGFNSGDVTFSTDNLLAVGSIVLSNWTASATQDAPLRWTTNLYQAPSFGGYALAALDVVSVTYPERACTWQYTEYNPVTALYEDKTHVGTFAGVNAAGAAARERWTVVIGTEQDSRKPYVEVRKTNGERVRLYAAGHVLTGVTTLFRYAEDGSTVHAAITDPTIDVLIAGEFTQRPGILVSFPALGNNHFPAEGLAPEFEFPTTKPAESMGNFVTGEGAAASLVEQIQANPAATQPSFTPGLTSRAVPTTGLGAWSEINRMFAAFGISAATEGSLAGTSMQDWALLVLNAPAQAQAAFGSWMGFPQFFIGLALVYYTIAYAWDRFFWMLGMRDPEGASLPTDVPDV